MTPVSISHNRYAPQRNQNQGPRQFGNMPPPQNQQASVPQGGNQQIQNQPPRQYNAVAPPQMYHPDPSNSQNRAPRPQKKGPRRDNDYPLPGSFVTAITILMGNGQVQLPPERKTAPYPGLDLTKYCPFHRSPGHTLETCWDARDLIYDLHETGRIDWDALQACQNNRRNMGIVENPLPNHQQAVQQPVQQNPNQNQNQAQVNTLFSSEELSPQDRGIGGTHQSLNWELQDTGVEWQGPVQSTIEEPTQCTTDDVEAPDSTSVSANTQERPLATRLSGLGEIVFKSRVSCISIQSSISWMRRRSCINKRISCRSRSSRRSSSPIRARFGGQRSCS